MLLYCPQFCKTFTVSSRSTWPASDAAWGWRQRHPMHIKLRLSSWTCGIE